ncbi:MAG: hypothetical protein V4714_21340 [Bacteroidota bacterium]
MNALHILTQLHTEHNRKQYPSVPAYALPKKRYSDITANGLTACIIDYIHFSGGYAARINTQGQWNEKLNQWTKGQTAVGTADIHACLNGMHLSIEVKIGRDKQSEAQKRTQKKVQDAGGAYYLATDFQGFYEWTIQIAGFLNPCIHLE